MSSRMTATMATEIKIPISCVMLCGPARENVVTQRRFWQETNHSLVRSRVWPMRSVIMERRKLHASALSHRNRLTFLSNQFHLNTILSMLTAITALVRGFKLIDANREVSTRAPVWEGFHSALFGVNKPNLAFRLKVDQECLLNFGPWHRVRPPSREAAWQEHRGVEWNAKFVRLTEIWFLARLLLIWMETESKKGWIYLLSKLRFFHKI